MINLKACWIDEGHGVDITKLSKHGITSPYLSPRDKNTTAISLANLVQHGFSPGLYWAWNWYNGNGADFARQIDIDLHRIGWQGNANVCADIETHDISYLLDFMHTWRLLRPKRNTFLTVEGMQGGLLDSVKNDIIAGHFILAPQLYDGNMNPLPHSPIIDAMLIGLPSDLIVGMYDAARLPYRWSGFAFTQGRLPQ